jgi:citrate synthase
MLIKINYDRASSCQRIRAGGARKGAEVTEWIGAAEAADRLGIKPASLYAYVSRGVLSRRRDADGRVSMFDADEIAELARKGKPRRPAGSSELIIETAVTEITEHSLHYRGLDAIGLARHRSFEDVANLLWAGSLPDDRTPGIPRSHSWWKATPAALRPPCLPPRCRWSGCR